MNRKQRRAAEKTRQRAAGPLKPGENVAIRAAIDAPHGRITEVNANGRTIGLCMIVKNEAHVILRCLESVRPIVDYVLIEDTGSTDGTQTIIREWLDRVGLPGEVYDEPWRDFAYNRSHVLAKLRQNQNVDYALIVDADDHITFDADFDIATFKKSLSQDMYDVELRGGPARYLRPQICSNRLKFRYRGVLHEFLENPRGRISRGKATGFYTTSTREGARSQDPEKYRKDAALLEKALRTERDQFLRSRYTFYLARSYENAGDKELALKPFLKRATLGYWTEEIFMSLYSAGHLQEALGRPVEEVIATFMRASKAAPTRAEALHAASRVCRENKRFAEGYDYARRGLAIPLPANGLFVVSWIYEYGLLDEFAINAYWIERYQDCLDACERLLREGKMPADMHDRVKKNADFARHKLAERVRTLPEEVPTVSETSRANESEPKRPRVILICGPWGSGTSVVAGLLDRMGAFGLGPYFETDDPKTANSYESVPFREIIRNALGYPSQPGLPFTPAVPGAVQSDLRSLQTRIEQQEFGPYDFHSSKPIFLKYPLSAFVIPQICEVFDTKLIYVMRPLEDIEQTRLRRNWEPYYGAEGGALIYNEMSAALKHHPYPTMTIDYKDLLASPMVHASNIARFVGLDLSPAELQHAVDFVRKPDAIPPAFNEMRRDDKPQTAPGGEPEELFVGLYNAAKQLPKVGRPFDEVIAAYERASNAAPNRAEALHAASRLCRENKRFEEGYEYACRGLKIPPPGGGLSIQQWIYEYGLLDELAVNAYWAERYQDCLDACQRLLREGKMPQDMHDRVKKNADFAAEKIKLQNILLPPSIAPETVAEDGSSRRQMEAIFVHAYENNAWGGRQSRSGIGSELEQTRTLIAELPNLFRSLGNRTLLDIPCGDFHWMKQVDLSGIDYVGADIVAPIIEHNRDIQRAPNISFRILDLTSDPLPKVDLILCRDCLVHLSYDDIFRALRNIKASGSTYLLATTFVSRVTNFDCKTGSWRVLNLEKPPFLFPSPLRLVTENCTENAGIYADKSLALWRLNDIANFPPDPGSSEERSPMKLLYAARQKEELARPNDEVISAYIEAAAACPTRAEALHGAARYCRNKSLHERGYEFAAQGLAIPYPHNAKAVENWIYEYGLLDELAVNAYWAERYQDCLDACQRLLREGKMPQDMHDRVKKNADFAAKKIKLQNILLPPSIAPETVAEDGFPASRTLDGPVCLGQAGARQFRIFRTIHVVWVGDEKLRPDKCIESWREKNPDWTVRVWGNDELRSEKWQNIAHIRQMLTRELCGVADMMRWEILDRHGGFAIDADSICDRPLEDWLFEPEIFACWENEIARPGLIANGYVYSHPANPLIRQVISDIRSLPDVKGGLAWQVTGPQRLTDTFRSMGYIGLTIYPSHYFMPDHFKGVGYKGSGPVFARQMWGRARPKIYEDLVTGKIK